MVFFACGELVLVFWAVDPILRNRYGIQGQNYVVLLQENETSAGLNSRNLILGIECQISSLMVSTKEFNRGVPRPFLRRAGCILTLQTIDGRNTRLNFVIFVVWSALTVGRWVVLQWSRKLGQRGLQKRYISFGAQFCPRLQLSMLYERLHRKYNFKF